MTITIDGLNIAYDITGSGDETIVMLQGWGTEYKLYNSIRDILNTKYRFVQFDFPGFGGSDEPEEPWDVDHFTDFFIQFMTALDIKKATLMCHSFGGRVVIKLCSRENLPFEIDRLVMIDAAGVLPVRTKKQERAVRRYKFMKKIYLNKFVYWLFPEIIDDWKSRQGSADYRAASPMMKQCLVKAINEDLTALLPNIKYDTLLVWGENDTATPLRDAKIMEEKIPNSGLVVFEGAGHFSYIEKPNEFKNVMTSYFKLKETT